MPPWLSAVLNVLWGVYQGVLARFVKRKADVDSGAAQQRDFDARVSDKRAEDAGEIRKELDNLSGADLRARASPWVLDTDEGRAGGGKDSRGQVGGPASPTAGKSGGAPG